MREFEKDELKEVLRQVILELLQEQENTINVTQKESKIVEQEITQILTSLGMPRNVIGFKYTREAVMLVIENNRGFEMLTKEIYPKVAKKFDTTPTKVERSIRHAIEIVWSRGNVEKIEEIFGYTVDVNKGRATNGQFISLLADEIQTR